MLFFCVSFWGGNAELCLLPSPSSSALQAVDGDREREELFADWADEAERAEKEARKAEERRRRAEAKLSPGAADAKKSARARRRCRRPAPRRRAFSST